MRELSVFCCDWLGSGLCAMSFALVCVLSFRREEGFKALDMGIAALLFSAAVGVLTALAARYVRPVAALIFTLLLFPGAALFSAMLNRRADDVRWFYPAAMLGALAAMLLSCASAKAVAGVDENLLRALAAVPAGAVCVLAVVFILRRPMNSGSAESWNGTAPAMLTLCAIVLLVLGGATAPWQAAACVVALAGCAFIYRSWGTLATAEGEMTEVRRRDAELENIITMQRDRYSELEAEIAAARTARHDLRHHLSAIRQFADSGDVQAVKDYLEQYGGVPADAPLTWCGNSALDSVAQHYLGQAKAEGIELDTVIDIGEDAGIPAPDLCVVLGNSLENALEAARKAPRGKRFIRVRAESVPGWVAVVIGNGYAVRPLEAVGGGYRSSKQEGRVGVGLSSIRAMAEKYDGEARFEAREDMFMTSVIMFKGSPAAKRG